MDRRRELAGLGEVPRHDTGSALLADISGFTRLTAELGETLGPRRGAEEITLLLNKVFGPITASIDRYGGSITAFGGDSVIAWFSDDDGYAATTVAVELTDIVRSLRDTAPGSASSELDIKVAVASGSSIRMRVGDPVRGYMDLMVGKAIDALAAETEGIQAGDVAVSPQVAAALGDRAVMVTKTEGGRERRLVTDMNRRAALTTKVNLFVGDIAGAEHWLLPLVRHHLEEGVAGLMSQLREVVAMFLGFTPSGKSSEDDAEEFARFVSQAVEVIAGFEGMVLQALADEKGYHLYAVFGASISHEDELRRAVVAALEIVAGANNGTPQARAGIAAGTAFVGVYGGPHRMTYGTLGPGVNLAARLMEQAPPGAVYVPEEVGTARGLDIEFTEAGTVQLHGVSHPVTIFQTGPTQRRPLRERRLRAAARLIGREEERSVLATALAHLHKGEGGVVIVEGPAGIGKTHLLLDLVEQAGRAGSEVIFASGEEIEHATALFAWRSVLSQLFGSNAAEAEIALLSFIDEAPWRAERVGLLRSVLASPVEDTYLTAGMDPELRLENTQQLIAAIVRDVPRLAPLILVLDDGHWMDSASWAMAERVAREVPSVLVVIGTRPFLGATEAPDEYTTLLDDDSTKHIVLHELEPAEALELVEICLGVESLPGPVSEMIIEQADGHPYFSEEIAFALRDAGLLIVENGESRLAPEVHDLGGIDLAHNVQELITGRFDRLSVLEQNVLKVASVIGREFSLQAVTAIYPTANVDVDQMRETLESLIPVDLIHPVPEVEDRYRFRHAITRDIAYGMLLYSQRHDLHRAVARWMEGENGADLDAVLAPLAYHYRNSLSPSSSGDDVDRALDYLSRAGRKSLRSFAHREAIGFLSDAVALATGEGGRGDLAQVKLGHTVPDRMRARWEQDLAEAHLGMGRVDQSAAHFERSLELHGHPMGRGKIGVGARLLPAIALQAGHRVLGAGARPLEPEQRADLIEAATAYERLMKIYYYANDPGSLITAALSGLNLAERAGTSPVLARIYANMSIVAGIIPLHRLARTYQRRSREVADQVDRLPEHAWVRLATSVYGVGVGEWGLVEPELRESYDMYKRLSDSRQMAENLGTTGQMLTAQGRFTEVYSLGEELRELGASRDDAQAEMWGWLYQGTGLLRKGDPGEALVRLRKGESLLHAGVGGANVGWLHGVMAETYWRLGNRDRARAAAASAAESLYAERPGVVFALDGFTGAAELFFGLWAGAPSRSSSAAKDAAERATKKLIGYSKVFPIGEPAALRYSGRVKEHRGDPRSAQSTWEKALERARELKMPFEEALTLMNMGRLAKDPHRLQQALDLFQSLGAAYFADLVSSELRPTRRDGG
jgi:class 3 adenylate cyclase/tetratricopeptide (TPR) repeat protein